MATMKSYTDISQSKKLAEILPIESADMYYSELENDSFPQLIRVHLTNENWKQLYPDVLLPAWSLAALIDMLPPKIVYEATEYFLEIDKNPDKSYDVVYNWKYFPLLACNNETLVDACYEIILKLHELKML